MQELEKILEEIEQLRGQVGSECTSEDHYIKMAWEFCLDLVEDIIRKHMSGKDTNVPTNDGCNLVGSEPEERGAITMIENEAIRGLMFLKEKLYNGIYSDRLGCIDHAVHTLKEIQQYREIGTVEECQEAADKQKPKKLKELDAEYGYFICGNCGGAIACTDDFKSHKYCLNCGQAIDWEESEEE